jgi:hypothetical protein
VSHFTEGGKHIVWPVFSWIGVTMYLTLRAIEATLATVLLRRPR